MKTYDLIVIGSGPAGEKGAAQAAYFGKSVALIEKEPAPGGACVNTGTIPSKTLRESAMHLSGWKQRGLYGVDVSVPDDISVSDFMYHERAVVEKGWELIDENMARHGIDLYRGCAHFASPHEVVLDVGGSQVTLCGEVILIATGSSPHRPENVPFNDQTIYDSDSVLTLDRIPKTMAVVGAGVIGCEYASIFAALGVDVSLVDGRIELLPHVDQEISDVLLRQMRNRLKIHMCLGDDVESITCEQDTCVILKFKNGRQLRVEKVLYAAGRQSNTAKLDLEKVGVVTGKRGIIPVNEHYQTNVPHIYAAGDVIGFPALASTSMEQARVAAVHAFNLKYKTHIASIFPYAIYTIPELSMIGLTEEECLAKGIDYEVGRSYYRNNARGQIVGDTGGLIKLLFDRADRKILGVHIVGENAAEIVHVGSMVMHFGGTLDAFIETVFNYPTLCDAYKYAAYDGLDRLSRRARNGVASNVHAAQANEVAQNNQESNNGQTPNNGESPQSNQAAAAPAATG